MDRAFTINFTTDLHGYVFPTDYLGKSEKRQGLSRLTGGFARGANTLTIDGGDLLQGSPFTAMLHKLRPQSGAMAQAMNAAGYDYVALGNHDFNYGVEHLRRYLEALNARCLCCNVRDRAGRLPLHPCHVHQMENGLRVGLIGAVTHHITHWEPKETLDQLLIENPLDAVRRLLPAVRAESDVVAVVYHGGFEKDLETGRTLSETDENQGCLLAGLPGVDLLLTGHQHLEIVGRRYMGTPVVQAGCNAQGFVRAECAVKGGALAVSSAIVRPDYPADRAVLAPLEGEEALVQRALDEPLATLSTAIAPVPPVERALFGSLAANFINQVQRAVSGADISACAIAAERLSLPERVTVREVLAAYPYANTLFVAEVTGALLKRYIEQALTYFEVVPPGRTPPVGSPAYPLPSGGAIAVSEPFLRPKIAHYNYDFFSGVAYTCDLSRPPLERLTSCTVKGRPVRDGDVMTLCLNSYRAGGSGGYAFLKQARLLREIQRDVATLIIQYLTETPRAQVDQTRYITALLP